MRAAVERGREKGGVELKRKGKRDTCEGGRKRRKAKLEEKGEEE